MSTGAERAEAALAAEAAFAAHDFDSDAQFAEYTAKVDLVATGSAQALETKLRRRYYRQKVDPNLAKEPISTRLAGDPSGGAQQARSAPEQPAQAATAGGRFGPLSRIVEKAQLPLVLSVGSLLLCTVGLLSVFGAQADHEKRVTRALSVTAISYVISLLTAVGAPKFNQEYLQRLLRRDDFHYLFYCLTFHGAPSVQVCLVPIFIFSLFNSARALRSWATSNAPRLLTTMGLGDRITALMNASGAMLAFIAQYEIFLLPYLVLTIVQRKSKGMFTVLSYLNFLRLRHRESAYSRTAWTQLDERITALLGKYVSSALPMYQKAKTWLQGFVR